MRKFSWSTLVCGGALVSGCVYSGFDKVGSNAAGGNTNVGTLSGSLTTGATQAVGSNGSIGGGMGLGGASGTDSSPTTGAESAAGGINLAGGNTSNGGATALVDTGSFGGSLLLGGAAFAVGSSSSVTSMSTSALAGGSTSIVGSDRTAGGVVAAGSPSVGGVNGTGSNQGVGGVDPVGGSTGSSIEPAAGGQSTGGGTAFASGGESGGSQTASGGSSPTQTCGDGILNAPLERCDPGMNIPNIAQACITVANSDALHPACSLVPGWVCETASCRQTTCGDGIVEGSEGCDPVAPDNNLGDGCTPLCTLEPSCPAEGGPCSTRCGDGLVMGSEQCDDGNAATGDGCSSTCHVEEGFTCAQPPLGDTMVVPMVVRDFNAVTSGDFEPGGAGATGSTAAIPGIVKPNLDSNGLKPVFSDSPPRNAFIVSAASFAQWYDDAPSTANPGNAYNGTVVVPLTLYKNDAGTAYVNRWGANGEKWNRLSGVGEHYCGSVGNEITNAEGVAIPCTFCVMRQDGSTQCAVAQDTDCQKLPNMLSCAVSGSSYYGVFAEAAFDGNPLFFPADSLTPFSPSTWAQVPGYYDSSYANETGKPLHNFSFTTEVRFWFQYNASENYQLSFLGDDDVWVFINKRLAVDLGGLHSPVRGDLNINGGAASVTVTNISVSDSTPVTSALDLGLVDGSVYEIVVFQAERQTKSSSYMLSLSGFNAARSICTPKG